MQSTIKLIKSQEKEREMLNLDSSIRINDFDEIFSKNSEIILSVKSINLSMSSDDLDIFNEKESTDERISNMSNSSAINKIRRFPSPTQWMLERHKKGIADYLNDEDVSVTNTSFQTDISQVRYSDADSSARSSM